MDPFEFHADLFEVRTAVLEELAENGFVWLSDFGAVDLQHDVYGVEVTAIRQESDANAIERLLRDRFPSWRQWRTFYEDHNVGELGWKVMISHSRENFDDRSLPTDTDALPWVRYRFTLRTLLIATTLVAVVLGLILWAAR